MRGWPEAVEHELAKSIEEIGLAKKAWSELAAGKKKIKQEMRRADERRKLLNSVAGNRIDTEEVRVRLVQLPSRWENFEIAMEAFNDMIEEQREALKGEVDARATPRGARAPPAASSAA